LPTTDGCCTVGVGSRQPVLAGSAGFGCANTAKAYWATIDACDDVSRAALPGGTPHLPGWFPRIAVTDLSMHTVSRHADSGHRRPISMACETIHTL
jgi:hypothetical protein